MQPKLAISQKKGIFIQGIINPQDDEKFRGVIGERRFAIVLLDSEGGDLTTAMEIGRIIRKRSFTTLVRVDERCASACVFILAAGVRRIVTELSEIVIHRPFLTRGLSKGGDYDKHYKNLADTIRHYLHEMNIPTELADRMMAIPPYTGERLSAQELSKYLLDGDDPAYAQEQAVREAKYLGISLVEHNRRTAAAEKACQFLSGEYGAPFATAFQINCNESIMQGNSISEVSKRKRYILKRSHLIEALRENDQFACVKKYFLNESNECPLR